MKTICLLGLLIFSLQLFAQAPKTISFQGVLTDTDGEPLPDGSYELDFRLYDDPAAGQLWWQETQQVATIKGVFSTVLGSGNALDLAFDQPYWLGISVDGGNELVPRTPLTAVPYSLDKGIRIEPGEELAVIDMNGDTAYILRSDGSSRQKGAAAYERGIFIKLQDSMVYFRGSDGWMYIGPDTLTDLSRGLFGESTSEFDRVKAITSRGVALYGLSQNGSAVIGKSHSASDAVVGICFSNASGVFGSSQGTGSGVEGNAEGGAGVRGESNSSHGVEGFTNDANSFGVVGRSANGAAIGVAGFSEERIGIFGRSVNRPGIWGESQDDAGVFGLGNQNIGVKGASIDSSGVAGLSESGNGVFGKSSDGAGLRGESINDVGVIGKAIDKPALQGQSRNSAGVFGFSTNDYGLIGRGGEGAALLQGDVRIVSDGRLMIDNVPEESSDRVLVWSDDKYVKWRPASDFEGGGSFDGLLVDQPLVLTDANGDTTTYFMPDGTSLHTGVETFTDDVILTAPSGKGIKLIDENGETVAGFGREDLDTGERIGVFGKAEKESDLAAAFVGDVNIQDGQFLIQNAQGDTLFLLLRDGRSLHTGREAYRAGIDLGAGDGSGSASSALFLNGDNEVAGFLGFNDGNQRTEVFGIGRSLSDWAGFFQGNCGIQGNTFSYNSSGQLALGIDPNADPVNGYTFECNGNAMFNGFIEAQGKNFVIDHPLQPDTKTLRHYSVESDRMQTVYNGNALLDEDGEAVVELPDWFEALNMDFSYQLTCIGGFANVYISEKIENSRFGIAGGYEGLEVSWQVTGVRHDPVAEKYRRPVVEEKRESNRSLQLQELRPPEVRR